MGRNHRPKSETMPRRPAHQGSNTREATGWTSVEILLQRLLLKYLDGLVCPMPWLMLTDLFISRPLVQALRGSQEGSPHHDVALSTGHTLKAFSLRLMSLLVTRGRRLYLHPATCTYRHRPVRARTHTNTRTHNIDIDKIDTDNTDQTLKLPEHVNKNCTYALHL